MSRVTQFLIASVFLLSTSAAFAEDMKVGYVDMQRALNETEDGRKAKEKLKKDFDQKQKELDEQQAALKKDMEDLEKKRTLLPADKVQAKEAEMRGRLEKLQQTYVRLQQDLSGKEQKETQKIFERMTGIIQQIAAAENFSMIVDKSALVFAKPHLDLTNELIRRYNGGGTGGQKTAPPAAPKPPAKK
ncbi:MAG TPA: OmpH family outer membrane protein [Polyangia bacterium]|nr:OmpH family outer membrane protein [Polyangia bacterium]